MRTDLIVGIICLLLAELAVVLKKAYFSLPSRELKRRAEQDENYTSLYRAAAYGDSLRGLLWLVIGLASSAGFILLAKAFPLWLGLILVALLIYLTFSLLPSIALDRLTLLAGRICAPMLAWLLNYLHKRLLFITNQLKPHYQQNQHTGLFEISDLSELIRRQKNQPDNRIDAQDLELLKTVLAFEDKKVADVYLTKKQVRHVLASDVIGPILINELHQHKLKLALVREEPKGDIIGSLAAEQLSIHSTGLVGDVMKRELYYLHEEDPLDEAIKAFVATNEDIFVVIDEQGKYLGVITLNMVLEQLFGHVTLDKRSDYTNKAAEAK